MRPEIVPLDGREPFLSGKQVGWRGRTVEPGLVCAPATTGLVHHVDGVALAQEKLRPAFPAVGRPGEIRAGLISPVDHQDGITMFPQGGNLELRVDLAAHRLRAVRRGIFSSGKNVAFACDGQRRGRNVARSVARLAEARPMYDSHSTCAHGPGGPHKKEQDTKLAQHAQEFSEFALLFSVIASRPGNRRICIAATPAAK